MVDVLRGSRRWPALGSGLLALATLVGALLLPMLDGLGGAGVHAALQRELERLEQPEDAAEVAPLARGRVLPRGEQLSVFYTSRWSPPRLRAHLDAEFRRQGWRAAHPRPVALVATGATDGVAAYCKPGYWARYTPASPGARGAWTYSISLSTLAPERPCP